ncbi:MAG: cbb3-type cytochrome c oxidase subunit II [Opitutae bacterium]|nr:cbb3-type cytochrome c oxidase subunit II [Opitutae bacterium]
MKNGLTLFLGVFATLALSWAGVLLTAQRQFGGLAQYKDPADESLNPAALSGIADQGRMVYQDLGCVSCHTQQVRREGFGADIGRGWGTRQSVARDYLREKTVLIGQARLGPDLRNAAARPYADAEYFYNLLYAPQSVAPGTNMPSYDFLFDVRPASDQPSPHALRLTGRFAPAPGTQIVPSRRADELVAYLLSLKDTYDYPEARPFVEPKQKEGGH